MISRPYLAETVEILGGALLAKPGTVQSERDLAQLIRDGVPTAAVRFVVERLGESESLIFPSIGIPLVTLRRRSRTQKAVLNPAASERAVRLGRIAAMGREALGSTRATGRWLVRPNRALGGVTPLSLLDTEIGSREVEAVLGRALYGGYS